MLFSYLQIQRLLQEATKHSLLGILLVMENDVEIVRKVLSRDEAAKSPDNGSRMGTWH